MPSVYGMRTELYLASKAGLCAAIITPGAFLNL